MSQPPFPFPAGLRIKLQPIPQFSSKSLSFPDKLWLTRHFCLMDRLFIPIKIPSYSLTYMGPTSESLRRNGCFLSTGGGKINEPSILRYFLGLLVVGCIQPTSIIYWWEHLSPHFITSQSNTSWQFCCCPNQEKPFSSLDIHRSPWECLPFHYSMRSKDPAAKSHKHTEDLPLQNSEN
jgi:hypothetical protein